MTTPADRRTRPLARAAYFSSAAAIVAGIALLLTVPSDRLAALLIVLAGCLTAFTTSAGGAYAERRDSYATRNRTGGPRR